MRVQITFDGATTEQVRQMALALNKAGLTSELRVGLDGPEKFNGATPKMTEGQFATVVGTVVKYKGRPIGEQARAGEIWTKERSSRTTVQEADKS